MGIFALVLAAIHWGNKMQQLSREYGKLAHTYAEMERFISEVDIVLRNESDRLVGVWATPQVSPFDRLLSEQLEHIERSRAIIRNRRWKQIYRQASQSPWFYMDHKRLVDDNLEKLNDGVNNTIVPSRHTGDRRASWTTTIRSGQVSHRPD